MSCGCFKNRLTSICCPANLSICARDDPPLQVDSPTWFWPSPHGPMCWERTSPIHRSDSCSNGRSRPILNSNLNLLPHRFWRVKRPFLGSEFSRKFLGISSSTFLTLQTLKRVRWGPLPDIVGNLSWRNFRSHAFLLEFLRCHVWIWPPLFFSSIVIFFRENRVLILRKRGRCSSQIKPYLQMFQKIYTVIFEIRFFE